MSDDDPIEVDEVVVERAEIVRADEAPAGAVVEQQPGSAAIAAAVDAALGSPDMPGREEFLNLAAQARLLSLSGAAPKLVRNDPYIAFHLAMVGRDFGISLTAAAAMVDVIDTKSGPQLSLSPQLMNGQLRRLGLGSIVPGERTFDRAVAIALDPNGQVIGESEFTWEEAQIAGLAGRRCTPQQHSSGSSGSNGCGCGHGWRAWPKRMLWWRAAGFCADDYFPEASLGLYRTPDMLDAVDVDGRPIDPATVELPPGYEPQGGGPGAAQQAEEDAADAGEIWQLQARIAALPDAIRGELRAKWTEQGTATYGYRPARLPAKALRYAKAMLGGFEARARKEHDGWDADAERDNVLAMAAERALDLVRSPLGGWPDEAPVDEYEVGDADPGAGPIDPPTAPAEDRVVDLMAALDESVAAAKAARGPREVAATASEEPEAEQATGVIICSRGQGEPTPEDHAAVQRFAGELARAQQAVTAPPVPYPGDDDAVEDTSWKSMSGPERARQLREEAESLRGAVEGLPEAILQTQADVVKALSWQAVDTALRARELYEDGLHPDARRMRLTAALANEEHERQQEETAGEG